MSYYAENPSIYEGNHGFTLSTKREVSKFVTISKNGTYTIIPDHPDKEVFSGITLNVSVPNPCVKQGYNTFIVPAQPGEEDQQIIEVEEVTTETVVASHNKNSQYDIGTNIIKTFDPNTKTVVGKVIVLTE